LERAKQGLGVNHWKLANSCLFHYQSQSNEKSGRDSEFRGNVQKASIDLVTRVWIKRNGGRCSCWAEVSLAVVGVSGNDVETRGQMIGLWLPNVCSAVQQVAAISLNNKAAQVPSRTLCRGPDSRLVRASASECIAAVSGPWWSYHPPSARVDVDQILALLDSFGPSAFRQPCAVS
jgi:hypothetical protein